MTSQSKLTDTQLILLSAASQRDDGLLVQPARLRGGAAQAVTGPLLASGLIEEMPVGAQDPYWRTADDGAYTGLRITSAGMRAIGLEAPAGAAETDGPVDSDLKPDASETPGSSRPASGPVRDGSKLALILSLVQRPEGATLDDLASETDWLPHTTRAALTGLRQRGYPMSRIKTDQGQSVYRLNLIAEPSTADAPMVEA
jgi:hypothetical protein